MAENEPAALMKLEPKLELSRENFGLCLLKPYYRSWLWHWCDGHSPINGKWQAVTVNEVGDMKPGYRIIPRYTHADMREFYASFRLHGGTNYYVRPRNDAPTNYYGGIEAGTGVVLRTSSSWATNINMISISTWTNFIVKPTRWQLFKMFLGL